MGKVEWSMWANEQALVSATVVLMGGLIGLSGVFRNWEFSIFAVIAAVLVYTIEYPRGERHGGGTTPRRFQELLSPILRSCGPVTRNYYVRFLLYLMLGVPCCFILPTLLGGLCLFITSIIYFLAAFRGEQWIPVAAPKASRPQENIQTSEAPTKPPPRNPNIHAEHLSNAV